MKNNQHCGSPVKSRSETPLNAVEDLGEAGAARRSFLSRLGKWGAALAVFGLGAETTIQALFRRSALSSAMAAGFANEDIPPPPEPTGTIYWVATNGSDKNNGTESFPFATVQKALDSCRNGDGVYVKAGYYVSGRVNWTKSGIILRGAPGTTREQVIIERSGSGVGATILIDSNRINNGDPPVEDCQIYGLTVQGGPEVASWTEREANWKTEAIQMRGYVHEIKVINCVVRHAYSRGCLIGRNSRYSKDDFPHNIEFAYNEFYKIGTDTAGADISLGPSAGFIHIHHNDLHGDVTGVVTEGNHIGSLIEGNLLREHFGPRTAEVGHGDYRDSEDGTAWKKCYTQNPLLPEGTRSIIRHNVVYGQPRYTGISMHQGTKSVDIYGNTIYECGVGILVRTWSGGINNPGDRNSPPDYTRDIRIWGNEIYDCYLRGFSMDAYGADGVQFIDNLVYDCGNVEDPFDRRQSNRYTGIFISSGWNIEATGNVISNNGQLSIGKPQIDVSEASTSELASNNNLFYLPDSSFSVARVGGNWYNLTEWQSTFGQDGNSTEKSTRYQVPSPPQPPGSIEVSGRGSEYAAKRKSGAPRARTPGLIG